MAPWKLMRNHFLIIVITLMLGLGLTSACTGRRNPGEEIALEIGGRKISVEQVHKDIVLQSAELVNPTSQSVILQGPLLDSIVDHYIILEYAEQHDISVSQAELLQAIQKIKKDYPGDSFKETALRRYISIDQWKEALKRQLLRGKVFNSITMATLPPSHIQIEQYYRDHIRDFNRPSRVRFRQIVTRSEKKAREALDRIKKGESIADIAKIFSYSPEAASGGDVGWVEKGQLVPSMDKVLFSLPVGKVSPIVRSPYGYHIFQVIEKDTRGLRPLKDVVAQIHTLLYAEAKERVFKEWLDKQRHIVTVKVLKKSLERISRENG